MRITFALLLIGLPVHAQSGLDFDPRFASPLACLTSAIYYEARGEPYEGQAAVAAVVLNRMAHPAYPKSVCDVVLQGAERATGCQFTFTCDGSLKHPPDTAGWDAARTVAAAALAQGTPRTTDSTHYHTTAVSPAWASRLTPTQQIGRHAFYRMTAQARAQRAQAAALPAFSPWCLTLPQ